jgi:subtilisin family serine protease
VIPSFLKLIALALSLLLFTLSQVGPVSAQAPAAGYVPGEILVKFRQELTPAQAQRLLATAGMQAMAVSPYSGVWRGRVAPGREAATIAALRGRADVVYATLNPIVVAFTTPNDPNFPQQWGLQNSGATGGTAGADINAPAAWDLSTGSNQVIVAILDTGVALDHPDLQANIWLNPAEIPANGLDDDANGFIDDVNGWDFCKSLNCVSEDNNPTDDSLSGHGSHVAGIAAAVGHNGQGVSGVNWQAKIMPVKVLYAAQTGTASSIANGINYAVANGAEVINMSLGQSTATLTYPCPGFEVVHEAIQAALGQGVLVVAAAGNDNNLSQVSCPAAFAEALAVGATNYKDEHWQWNGSLGSNGGNRLAVVAPGGSDTEANKDSTGIYSTKRFGAYGYESGTSMATPFVSGLAGLLLAYEPNLSPADTRSIIEATVDDLGPAGHDANFGWGRIDAGQALEAVLNFRTVVSPTTVTLDDQPGPLPKVSQLQLLSAATNPVTWTLVVSPTVSWLTPAQLSGSVSATTSPQVITLSLTRPVSYGLYSTTLIINGVGSGQQLLGSRSTLIQLNYVLTYQQYLPLILKLN